MKNLFYKILLPVSFLILSLSGCKEDEALEPLPETVPLTMLVSNPSLIMGDKLHVEFDVDGRGLKANEDISIFLTAKSNDTDCSNLFENFPSVVTLKKGEMKLVLDLPIASGLVGSARFDLSAFVRGYNLSGATQSILVSDYYHTVLSLKDNVDKEVNEGSTFILTAKLAAAAKEDVVVAITPKSGEESLYDGLPASLTIPAGSMEVESEPVTIIEDGLETGNKSLTLQFSTTSTQHPLMDQELIISMKDINTALKDKLNDERYVYLKPEQPFVSAKSKAQFLTWMKNPAASSYVEITEGDAHPNEDLAAAGWSFLNALEFHKIAYSTNTYPEIGTTLPKYAGAQSTVTMQKAQAVQIEKFTNITDAGALRLWGAKGSYEKRNDSNAGTGEYIAYGSTALYICKHSVGGIANAAQVQKPILPGTRVEVRARIRGALYGTNPAIWLMGNSNTDNVGWPQCGEIDIMEAPYGAAANTPANTFWQTWHYGYPDHLSSNTGKITLNNIGEWHIYWLEWRSDTEVAMGINGETKTVLKRGSNTDANWPFARAQNKAGFKLILNMSLQNEWALGDDPATGWDSGFAGISYAESWTNENTPRMEIDWVRFYKNSTYDLGGLAVSDVTAY